MYQRLALSFALTVLGTSTATAGEALLGHGDEPRIQALIQGLGHQDYAIRQNAGRGLHRYGARALPWLRRACRHEDPEVRRRARAAIDDIEQSVALAPRRVSMHLKQCSLDQVLATISQQTGYRFDLADGKEKSPRAYDFDFERTPFWEVMDRVADTSGLRLWTHDEHIIRLSAQAENVPYVTRQGPFRVTADRLEHMRILNLSDTRKSSMPPRSEDLVLHLTISSEPKLPLLGVGEVHVSQACDDRGRSMVLARDPAAPEPMHNGPVAKSFSIGAAVALHYASPESRTIKFLRGTVPLTLLQASRPEAVMEDPAHSVGKSINISCGRLTVEDWGRATEAGAQAYAIRLSIRRSDKTADSSGFRCLDQRVSLQDASGAAFIVQETEFQQRSADEGELRLVVLPPESSAAKIPERLIVSTWTAFQHSLPFEFQNLPLP
jgi:hypothetical protein